METTTVTVIESPIKKRGRGRPRKYATTAEVKDARLERDIDTREREQLLVTTKQAADALQISERTVHALIKGGGLKSVKIGDSRRIPLDAVKLLATTGATISAY